MVLAQEIASQADCVRFHVSLNVNDLHRSVRFLTALLGVGPCKIRQDYAKFEPADLPIVLSLEPRSAKQAPLRCTAGEGPLNHIGIRLTNAAAIVDVQRRLEAAGYSTQRMQGVECCYAKQTKFWCLDDDQNMWEVYVLEGDIDHRGNAESTEHASDSSSILRNERTSEQAQNACCQNATVGVTMQSSFPPAPTDDSRSHVEHFLDAPNPFADAEPNSLQQITLNGTLNSSRYDSKKQEWIQLAFDLLRSGGKLRIHALTTDLHVDKLVPLPGPASVVQVVPRVEEIFELLENAGFRAVRLEKFQATPCFRQSDAEFRETWIEARKPAHVDLDPETEDIRVINRGPWPILLSTERKLVPGRVTQVDIEELREIQAHDKEDRIVVLSTSKVRGCGSSA